MASFAVAAGLIFARFSRPTARVLFSRVAVVTPFNGVPTLMFRCANERRNQIFEARVHVDFAREETSAEGWELRRSFELVLARDRNPQFSLSWTVMHPIDEQSPLYGIDPDLLAGQEAAIVVTLTGIDETLSQAEDAMLRLCAGAVRRVFGVPKARRRPGEALPGRYPCAVRVSSHAARSFRTRASGACTARPGASSRRAVT